MEASKPGYEYQVSLRIVHPTMAPESFTAALALDPEVSWAVGEPCKNRQGSIVPGDREESYWLHSFGETQGGDLPLFLSHVASNLVTHKGFFDSLSSSGGTVEFFVGYFIDAPNSSIPLGPELLKQCSDLGIGIYIDVYG